MINQTKNRTIGIQASQHVINAADPHRAALDQIHGRSAARAPRDALKRLSDALDDHQGDGVPRQPMATRAATSPAELRSPVASTIRRGGRQILRRGLGSALLPQAR